MHQPFQGKQNIISTILTPHSMEQNHPRKKINKTDTFLSIFVSTADYGPNETYDRSLRGKKKGRAQTGNYHGRPSSLKRMQG